jgi:Fe-S cluster biogenesis protein NfuA
MEDEKVLRESDKDSDLKIAVEEVLDDVRVYLRMEGGDVELIDVDDEGTVKVRLVGSCAGCPASTITLKMGIERLLKQRIEGIKEVINVP